VIAYCFVNAYCFMIPYCFVVAYCFVIPYCLVIPYGLVIPCRLVILYFPPNIVRMIKSRKMRWAGRVARIGRGRVVNMVLVGRPEGKRPLGISSRRWEDNIKMDFQEVGCGGLYCIDMAQDRDRWWALVYAVLNHRVP